MNFDTFCLGKRGKAKYPVDYRLQDYYKYYKEKMSYKIERSKYEPKTGNTTIVSEELYKKIIREYFEALRNRVVNDPRGIHIVGIGNFRVKKQKMNFSRLIEKKNLKVNWRKSKEAKQLVFYTNEHRQHYKYFLAWEKNRHYKYLKLYTFNFCRKATRAVSKVLTTDFTKDYFEKHY